MQAVNRAKVFLTGGDGIGWALDEDLRLTSNAIKGVVDLVGLEHCQIIHTVWWEGLNLIPQEKLAGKWIVCHVPGEPFRYFSVPAHRHIVPLVSTWISRSSQARNQLASVGIKSEMVPYVIDTNLFRPIKPSDPALAKLRNDYAIPADSYLIGSFQRDTEGNDLKSPKMVKGPDIFLEILTILRRRGLNFHVLLAGPRRQWLIGQLRSRQIPFTYVGQETQADDMNLNSLSRETLNILYNVLDLYVVSSRSEGGPHSILEAGASKCKTISSKVGLAPDLLEPANMYTDPIEAADIIDNDIRENSLSETVDGIYERTLGNHSTDSVVSNFVGIYARIEKALVDSKNTADQFVSKGVGDVFPKTEAGKLKPKSDFTVCLWHSFFEPPYGGGNQFMLALKNAFLKLGVSVRENELDKRTDAYILNSIHFDVDRFLEFGKKNRLNVVHRIDGPIHLIRGYDREKDELCFELNQKFASSTVLQSSWTYQRIVDMGYKPIKPVMINNAVDGEIFNPKGRIDFSRNRKIKLISTSWSNNPRKGGPIYKWIENNLDWSRFEYTFVGNVSENFKQIKHIPPVNSMELAGLLRNHDIYITASKNDPCSNALIEALSCGLPAIYYDDGGHPELVRAGGLAFRTEEEILFQLDRLVDEYESFRNLISVAKLEDVAANYLFIAREIAS
ncbi:MAG: glycosyltransferase [Pseudomonadota bacterium]